MKPITVNQSRLFDTPVTELLERYEVTPAIVTKWHQSRYLSFDPMKFDELDEEKEIEFRFISSLFASCLSFESVESLLKRLDKPYRYDLRSGYFDFLKNVWDDKQEMPDFEEQVEELIGNEENDVLLEIKERIEEYLDEIEEEDP